MPRWVYLLAIPLSAVSPRLNSEFWTAVFSFQDINASWNLNCKHISNPFSLSRNLKVDFWNLSPEFSFQLFFCILCIPRIQNKKWVHSESIPILFLNHVQSLYTVMACIPHISRLSWLSQEWLQARPFFIVGSSVVCNIKNHREKHLSNTTIIII